MMSKVSSKQLSAIRGNHVNPSTPFKNVFVFAIHKSYQERGDLYESTRKNWIISEQYRQLVPAYAVGVIQYQAFSAYKIENWYPAGYEDRFAFNSISSQNTTETTELSNKDWSNVLKKVDGFYRSGGIIIAEFDGKGKFRFVKGSKDIDTWYNCL